MSDSDDLALHVKRKKPTSSRSDTGGPSRKTVTGSKRHGQQNKRKNAPTTDHESGSDIQEVDILDKAEEVAVKERPQIAQGRRTSKKPSSAASTNTVGAAPQSKGKAKAAVPNAKKGNGSSKLGPNQEVLSIDDEEDEMDVDAAKDLAAAYNKANAMHNEKDRKGTVKTQQQAKSSQESKLSKENTRLKEEIERLKGHISDLKTKFEEMINIRETEAEALLNEQHRQFQAQIHAQKVLIADLHAQIAKKEPLLRPGSGKKAVVALLTREEADEESKAYKSQITALKQELGEAKRTIQAKDQEIGELHQQAKELKFDLEAEISRAKALASKTSQNPPSVTKNGAGLTLESTKAARVVRLYEDLTNVLVSGFKVVKSPYKGEDLVFNCVYTHTDPLAPTEENPPSLNFLLRFCNEPPPGEEYRPGMKLNEIIHYQPLELDKEKNDFVEKLGFLGAPFSFDRQQLALLVKTLSETLNESDEDDA